MVSRSNWSRHQRAHGIYQLGQAPRGRPRNRCRRSQHLNAAESSLDVFAVTRKVARSLYALNALGVPDYAQDAIVHYEFPVLSARERRISQLTSKTTIAAVRNEIRTALPYMKCHTLGIGTRPSSSGNLVPSQSSSASMIPPSGCTTGINPGEPALEASRLEDEAPPPQIQLVDSDTINIEVLPQTQVLEPSTMTPAVEVEKTEERIATKYKRKKRSHYGRDTTHDSKQLSGQLPGTLQSSGTSVKQTNEELKSVGRVGTQQKAYETASTQEVFGSAEKYVTPPEAQSERKEERHAF